MNMSADPQGMKDATTNGFFSTEKNRKIFPQTFCIPSHFEFQET